ncbi:MAG: hypothetical protein LAO18_23585 [Acidobacteriia bacterium]|nr:hypothetical protein [Terriglobia bacterium]
MLLASAISILFSLKRDAAPEKVNAISKPNSAKTAPSIVPKLLRSPSDSTVPDTKKTASLQQDHHAEEEQYFLMKDLTPRGFIE